MTDHQFFATAPKHLEALLAAELRDIGIAECRETRGGVSFRGGLAAAYRVCLWSRVANRVLVELCRFAAPSAEDLYREIQKQDWSAHLDVNDTLAVDFSTSQSTISHSQFGALKVKDAIVDQFRQRSGERPSVETERPSLRINVYLHRDQAVVSIDLSGDSLHRRGYRAQGVAAPLKENLAAALLLRAGWPEIARTGGDLVDPMCGSGTLPIEAALIAADIAPGFKREYWGFSGWRQHRPADWQRLLEEAQSRREQGLARIPEIRGYDADKRAVAVAHQNIERAGLAEQIQVTHQALSACTPPRGDHIGLVIVNPPYGERLGSSEPLAMLYAELGAVLKQRFSGWRAAVLTSEPELAKQIGLRATKRHSIYNGPIACQLYHFHVVPDLFSDQRQGPRPLPAQQRSNGAQMFANRLNKNQKQLRRWLEKEHIGCYRLYDADMPEYALAVDVYEGEGKWVHVQEYEAPASIDQQQARFRLREALGVILDVLHIPQSQLFFKVRKRQKGASQYEKLSEEKKFHLVVESGLRFWVNFTDYLDTGLFLDHRLTRQLIARLSKGKHFLNLFAYTGSATVYAAHGGAISTTSVDMSNTYLEWAQRNMQTNGFTGPQHTYIREDCQQWLHHAGQRNRYDLIFVDPPSFSTSKRMTHTFDVQRDHVALINDALALLADDGVLLFSNNLRQFKLDTQALAGCAITDLTRQTLPKDFERNPKIHHCWRITKA